MHSSYLVQRYLALFLPDAGVALFPCSRFHRDDRGEVKVVATKHWRAGELLHLLCGTVARVADEDELIEAGKHSNGFAALTIALTSRITDYS